MRLTCVLIGELRQSEAHVRNVAANVWLVLIMCL